MAEKTFEEIAKAAEKSFSTAISKLVGGLADAAKGAAEASLPPDVVVGDDGELHTTNEVGAPD